MEPLFAAQKELTGIHAFDKRGAQKGLKAAIEYGAAIGRQGFDLWISAHTSLRSATVCLASGITDRIGYDAPWYNRFVYTETVKRRFDELEEVERLMSLGRPLGMTETPPATGLDLPEAMIDEAQTFFKRYSGVPVLGIHPGSTWETKKWPEQNFAGIIENAVNSGYRVILFGGPEEVELADRIARKSGQETRITNLAGKLNLQQLAAYILQLDLYLTNDSGPMHIAWIQGVPVLAMFGPTVRKFGFFPRGSESTVLETPQLLKCRPCGLHGGMSCPEKHHRCMTDITVDTVWSEIRKKMENRKAHQ